MENTYTIMCNIALFFGCVFRYISRYLGINKSLNAYSFSDSNLFNRLLITRGQIMMDEATKLKLRNIMLDHKLTTWEIDSLLNNPEVNEEYFEHPAFKQFLVQRKAKAEESNQRKKQTVEKLPPPTQTESIEAQVAFKEIDVLEINGKAEDWMLRLRNNFIRNAMKRYDYD